MKKYPKYKNNSQKQLHKSSKGKTALAVTGISILALGAAYGAFHKQINSGVVSVVDRLKNPTKTTTKNDNNLQITALQNEITIKNEEIKKAVNQIEALINEKNQALEQQAALKEDVQAKTNTINTLKNELTQKQTAIDEKNAALTEKEAALTEKQAALTKLQEDYDALEISNAEYQSQKAQLEESISTLTNEKTTLTAEKSQLVNDLEAVNTQLSQKQTELDDTTTQLNTVTQNYYDLQNLVSALESGVEDKTQELNNLQAQYNLLQTSYDDIKLQITDIKNSNNSTKAVDIVKAYLPVKSQNNNDHQIAGTWLASTTPDSIQEDGFDKNVKYSSLYLSFDNYTAALYDIHNIYGNGNVEFNLDLRDLDKQPNVLRLVSSVIYNSDTKTGQIEKLTLNGNAFKSLDKPLVLDLTDLPALDINLYNFEDVDCSLLTILLPKLSIYQDRIDSYTLPKWALMSDLVDYNQESQPVLLNKSNFHDQLVQNKINWLQDYSQFYEDSETAQNAVGTNYSLFYKNEAAKWIRGTAGLDSSSFIKDNELFVRVEIQYSLWGSFKHTESDDTVIGTDYGYFYVKSGTTYNELYDSYLNANLIAKSPNPSWNYVGMFLGDKSSCKAAANSGSVETINENFTIKSPLILTAIVSNQFGNSYN